MSQKQHIVKLYEQTIDWVKNLDDLSEEQWRKPIAPGKWTIAEVVGHLVPWDIFILEQRLPYFFKESILPSSPNVDETNRLASESSKVKTKEELIISFVTTRARLIAAIKEIPNEFWSYPLTLKSKEISPLDYFLGLLDHDDQHFKEIHEALRKVEK